MNTRSSPSPTNITHLPIELLIAIFTHCTPTHPLSPLSLSLVCRFWHRIVHSSPPIWQLLSLSPPTTSSHAQAKLWLSKSSPLPFDVKVTLDDQGDMLLPLLSPLLSAQGLQRWRKCQIIGKRTDTLRLPPYPLDHLDVHIQDSPTHRRRTLSHRSMHIFTSSLPRSCSLVPMPTFTSLSITETTIENTTHPVRLLDFLAAFPSLEHLYFNGWTRPHEDRLYNDEDDHTLRPPVVHLPHLLSLHLRSTCNARTILSHIHTPSLTALHLEYLNVDYPLPPHTPPDPGDSDSPSLDPSQSPSSDHATGMGLRSLLTRSNPPLQVLEMDYADMRTKDFRWCFDRMGALEEFRIVASDMADSVVGLFAPLAVDGGRARVRVPKLKVLQLYNCQRLSGQAIVDAITARVRFTDVVGDGAETLVDVSIVGCEGLREGDALAMELGRELGERLRVAAI